MIIAVSDGLPRDDLASHPIGSVEASRQVAESVLPGLVGDQLPDGNLAENCYPYDGIYVGTFGDTWVLASQGDALYNWVPPFDGGRNAYRVFMQSVVSAAGFGYWGADGSWREFGGSYEDGAPIDGGQRLPFERPFWAGEMDPDGEVTALHGQEMPFHPMDLGEEALREFFGFVGEGVPRPDDLDAFEIPLHGFELLAEPRQPPPPPTPPPPVTSKGRFSRLLGRR